MFLVCGAAFSVPQEKPRKRVAVLNFFAENTEESTARIARNSVELTLFETKKFDIMEQQQIEDILKERKLILRDCMDEACAGDIGDMLSAEYVIIGSVSRLDKLDVQVKVINVAEKKIIIAQSVEVDDVTGIREASAGLSDEVAEKIEDYGKKGVSYSVSASFNYISPLGYFKDRAGEGYGVIFSGRAGDIFFKRFILGIDAGCLYFDEKPGVTHHSIFIPALLTAGYRIPLPWKLSFVPEISAGGSYDTVYYYTAYKKPDYTHKSSFQAAAKCGAFIEYRLPWDFSARLGAEYGSIFEEDGRLAFLSYSIGAGAEF